MQNTLYTARTAIFHELFYSAWLSVGVWRCILCACIAWVLELIKENTKIVSH